MIRSNPRATPEFPSARRDVHSCTGRQDGRLSHGSAERAPGARPMRDAPGMTTVADIVDSLGGLATKRQLVARGARDHHLTDAVRDGSVRRARNGWYSTWAVSDLRFQAVRIGGRQTGLSAIAALGGWVREVTVLDVAVPANASRLRKRNVRRPFDYSAPGGVRLHWESRDAAGRGSAAIVGLVDALTRVALDEPLEDAVAAFDWALHTGRIEVEDAIAIIERLPARMADLLDWLDPECESLPESLARTRARLRGLRVTSQVPVGPPTARGGRQRGDLLIEDVVMLEIDGRDAHLETFEADRSKDLDITIDGFHSIRPAANHVFHDWGRVARAIDTAIVLRRGSTPSRLENSGVARHAVRRNGAHGRRRRATPEFPPSGAGDRPSGAGDRSGRAGDRSGRAGGRPGRAGDRPSPVGAARE
ncbi:hypothetical protein QT381_02380 [Galbitalea sp. SE-J8]|uniref:hypothetical protein n=1 Tax=Galbitalea sp. SE-J8 TaxID=3054952 RepID=UPI00259C918D|nr:hypothetical protein [Galbitalea sp. SE-J8]MDM4761852.1 hypothetical protein [Galbitalea sp. SE-J8]